MGYYIIINPDSGTLDTKYIETLDQLMEIENLTKNSIIVETSNKIAPMRVRDHKQAMPFTEEWFRAGIKAQNLFKQQATKNGFMVEDIRQDQESFKSYTENSKLPIKRGDFLIRNVKNIEVDVKCRTFYNRGDKQIFHFSVEEFKKHKNMQLETGVPIFLAVYKRALDSPIDNSLIMISMDQIIELSSQLDCHDHPDKRVGRAYKIPISMTTPKFELLNKEKPNSQTL